MWFPMVMNWLFQANSKNKNEGKNKQGTGPSSGITATTTLCIRIPHQPCSLLAMSTLLALVSPILRDRPATSCALCSLHHFIAWLGLLLSRSQIKDRPGCPRSHMIQAGFWGQTHDAREPRTRESSLTPPQPQSTSLSLSPTLTGVWVSVKFRACCLSIRNPQTDPRGSTANAVFQLFAKYAGSTNKKGEKKWCQSLSWHGANMQRVQQLWLLVQLLHFKTHSMFWHSFGLL